MGLTAVGKECRPGGLGTSGSTGQWEGGNCSRAFPIADDSDSGGIPDGFLADACVVVPGRLMDDAGDSVACRVRVVSAHASPHAVSVSLETVGPAAMGGACVCTVLAGDFEPYRPYPLEPVAGSCVSGTVSFGDVLSPFAEHGTWKPESCMLSDDAVLRIPAGRLSGFVDDLTGETASGDVEFFLHGGVEVSPFITEGESQFWDEGEVWAEFSLDPQAESSIRTACEPATGFFNGEVSPIRSINGVRPDGRGRIAIVLD